jgi:hypothetical protein
MSLPACTALLNYVLINAAALTYLCFLKSPEVGFAETAKIEQAPLHGHTCSNDMISSHLCVLSVR